MTWKYTCLTVAKSWGETAVEPFLCSNPFNLLRMGQQMSNSKLKTQFKLNVMLCERFKDVTLYPHPKPDGGLGSFPAISYKS